MKYKEYLMEEVLEAIIDYRGKTPQKSETGIPTLSAKTVKNNYINYSDCYFISEEEYKRFMVRGFPKVGDILLTTEAPLGQVARLDRDDIALAQRLITLRGKHGVLDNDYLLYFLQSPHGQALLKARETGTTVTGIKQSEFRKIVIELPEYSVQRKICSILRSIDDKIVTNNKINDNLQQQAAALFESWFASFDQTDGEMPADWRKGTLGELTTITSGKRPPMKQPTATVDVKIPLVGAAAVMGFTNAILYNEPILVTGRVGTHGVVQRFQSPCWTSDNTLVIKSKFYEYTFQVLQRIDYVNMNRGSTQPLITQTDLKNVSIVIPTEAVLLEYEKIAGTLMAMYESNRKENERLAILRDTLLPRLMNGEIDVSNIEI